MSFGREHNSLMNASGYCGMYSIFERYLAQSAGLEFFQLISTNNKRNSINKKVYPRDLITYVSKVAEKAFQRLQCVCNTSLNTSPVPFIYMGALLNDRWTAILFTISVALKDVIVTPVS